MYVPLPGVMPGAARSLCFSTAERSSAGSFAMKRIRRKAVLNPSGIVVGCRILLLIIVRRTAPVGLVHMTDRRVTETKPGPVQIAEIVEIVVQQPQNIVQHTAP